MKTLAIIFGYIKWHYGKAIISLSKIWKNFLFFIFDFFSIKLLFQNFFDPWKRMTDYYPKSFDIKKYFYSFINNLIMRLVGMLMRTGMIIVSFISLIIFILIYPLILLLWLILPFIVLALILNGLFFIIK